jgi:hypothetical protein
MKWECIIREVIEIELHPDNMKVLSLSRSWKPLKPGNNKRRFSLRTSDLFPLDSTFLYTVHFRASPTITLVFLMPLCGLEKSTVLPHFLLTRTGFYPLV